MCITDMVMNKQPHSCQPSRSVRDTPAQSAGYSRTNTETPATASAPGREHRISRLGGASLS